jgi:hypothetical protein
LLSLAYEKVVSKVEHQWNNHKKKKGLIQKRQTERMMLSSQGCVNSLSDVVWSVNQ